MSASERITDNGRIRLRGLLDAGDPKGEVRLAWHAKEILRGIYNIDDPELGADTVNRLAVDFQDLSLAPEINRLGRTLWRWRTQIANWHHARVTNAATEPVNNLAKRVKRAAFGFTNYRIRALLYAGKPMRVRIEVGSIGGDGSQTLAPPVVVAFQLSASPPMPAR